MNARFRSFLLLLFAILIALPSSLAAQKTVHVKGYTKRDGTYVAPHDRAAPHSSTAPSKTPAARAPATHATPPATNAAPKSSSSGPKASTTPRSSAPRSSTAAPGVARSGNGRIARSETAKRAFERQTGHPNGWAGHVVDHVKPLACGGADTPANMQWQTTEQAKVKDRTERVGCGN